MEVKKIAIGADHAGFELKKSLIDYLKSRDYVVKDFGTFSAESTDYPLFGYRVAKAVSKGDYDRGVLICTTGIGMSIVANKVGGVRAALVNDVDMARVARQHNNANIISLGTKYVDAKLGTVILDVFLNTDFDEGERHHRRVNEINMIENGAIDAEVFKDS
ncbi:MAG: ribose 5-phosphate isomerase B [Actinobacteria bacterium]|nr:ribose 5-phosphate isomerase B [Actinomycetota bacterium]